MSEESNHPTSGGHDVPGASADGHENPNAPRDDPRWLDKPGSVDLLIKILIAACVLTVLADLGYDKHGEFHFQEFFGFDALYGFLAYVGLIHVAKGARILLMRSEDYYD